MINKKSVKLSSLPFNINSMKKIAKFTDAWKKGLAYDSRGRRRSTEDFIVDYLHDLTLKINELIDGHNEKVEE